MTVVCRLKITNCILFSLMRVSNTRNIFTSHARHQVSRTSYGTTMSKTEQQLRQRDNVPESYRLVYRAPMEYYCYTAKCVSSASVTLLMGAASWKAVKTVGILGLPLTSMLDEYLITYSPVEVGVVLGSYVCFNLALWVVASRYVLRIYSDGNQPRPSRYWCMMPGILPTTTSTLEFAAGDLQPANAVMRTFPWRDSYFHLGSRGLILFQNYFRTPADLHNMLGTRVQ